MVPVIEALPAPTMRLSHRVDVAISEWTADLSGGPIPTRTPSPTIVGAVGYVDYDTVDSVHETTTSTTAAR